MNKDTSNPFVLPGFGQTGEAADNPVFAGMEMMRQAWQGMAGGGQMDSVAASMMSVEDLERRIAELQAVESWLRLNLSMLGNTIQGMEIQRSTLATLRAFATSGVPKDFSAGSQATPEPESASAARPDPEPGAEADSTDQQPYAQAAEDWWNMVQQQFQTLAAATAATLQSTADAADAAPVKAAPAAKAARKTARKTAAPAKKAARKTTRRAT
ncbi:MAG: transcriptional regulator [Alcaligenaceae bacterium]|nr:transcriptional regulator [Alcaligenaceae bacterium]